LIEEDKHNFDHRSPVEFSQDFVHLLLLQTLALALGFAIPSVVDISKKITKIFVSALTH